MKTTRSDARAEPLFVSRAEAGRMLGYRTLDSINRLVEAGTLELVQLAPGMMPKIRREDVLALGRRRSS
jgi:hypothetical protein